MATRDSRVEEILAILKKRGSKKNREGMARYGIVAKKVFGVSVGDLQRLAKQYGRDHDLALALWDTEWYEGRMLCAFVDEPERVTAAQMDRWAKGFDNWAICDTMCMHLFDRTPHAWRKVDQWSGRKEEFVRRASFALLASLALHDKTADDKPFLEGLTLIDKASMDERNFVKKAVNWALRSIGSRNERLNKEASALAKRLAESSDTTQRWIGKDALRQLASPATKKRLASRAKRAALKA